MLSIQQMLAPINGNGARSGKKRTGMVGVTIHNTGNASRGAGAINHGKYLQSNGMNRQASWHYAVDATSIVQSIPEDEVAWHAGDGRGKGNMQTIAIEICMNPESNLKEATDKAAQLAATILKRHGLSSQCVFQHNHWSGKNCPQEIRAGRPYDWNTFLQKVKLFYEDIKKEEPVYQGSSLVDYLQSIHQDASMANRCKLAQAHGIVNYVGSASQNLQLLKILRGF